MNGLIIYLIAVALTYVGALGFWVKEFGDDLGDLFGGALLALLVAAVAPVIWFGLLVVGAVRLGQAGWRHIIEGRA